MKLDGKKLARIAIAMLAAVISIFVLAKPASSASFHARTIQALDEKRSTVMELTAASTAASAAITLLPGDAATPIADKLADLSGYFLIVLCAILLEKYLLTVTGYAAFSVLIPAACALFAAGVFWARDGVRRAAWKLLIFALAIFLVVPASVKVSDLIEAAYSASIQETIDAAKGAAEGLEESAGDAEEPEGFLPSVISGVKDGIAGLRERAETALNNFIEALAVMLVTSCVIPVVVLLFFAWLVKLLLGALFPAAKDGGGAGTD